MTQRCQLEPLDTKSRQSVIEALCSKGCRQVWRDIQALEQGETLAETRGLNAFERDQVLRELKEIMAVYDRCGAEEPPLFAG